MRKKSVGMHFASESGEGGHMQSEKWGKGKVPMFWKARDLGKMGERVAAKKMGLETRELKKMSFSGEIKSTVKVTSTSSEQRQSAREGRLLTSLLGGSQSSPSAAGDGARGRAVR